MTEARPDIAGLVAAAKPLLDWLDHELACLRVMQPGSPYFTVGHIRALRAALEARTLPDEGVTITDEMADKALAVYHGHGVTSAGLRASMKAALTAALSSHNGSKGKP